MFCDSKTDVDKEQLQQMKDVLAKDIGFFQSRLHRIMPRVTRCGNFIMKAIKKLIDTIENPIKREALHSKTEEISPDVFSSWVCESAITKEFHQENDSSYTGIFIPYCDEKLTADLDEFKFQFSWNSTNGYSHGFDIALLQGTSLYYNGRLLFHRQVPTHFDQSTPVDIKDGKKYNFWNISVYHNCKLFAHMRKSLGRNLDK